VHQHSVQEQDVLNLMCWFGNIKLELFNEFGTPHLVTQISEQHGHVPENRMNEEDDPE
jgi:hypothetical protein